MFCTPPFHDGATGGSFDVFQHMVSCFPEMKYQQDLTTEIGY